MKVMQTVIKGQQSERLIFFVENFMDVYRVVYAPFDRWLLADRDTDNLPMSCVTSTDISPRSEYATLCSHEDFRRRCIQWLREKERSDHPAVAVLATGVGEDE
jgi:hypothetical protein